MENEELIRIHWHVDRTAEPAMYMLVCDDPEHADMQVSVSSADMTERVAKAKLMQAMFELGKEKVEYYISKCMYVLFAIPICPMGMLVLMK